MKFAAIFACLASGALAVPSPVAGQTLKEITDSYSFDIALPEFIKHADAKDPPTLNWQTDGCTASPNDPFGFNFLPACRRHDFGYHNFRKQARFTESARRKIDDHFKKDLYYQCKSEDPEFVCKGLADVYYAAVRAFGRAFSDVDASPGKRAEGLRATSENLMAVYEEKLSIYNDLVQKAQDQNLLPVLQDQ